MDCSPPGSSVHGIFQARILEWVAMPSSRGPSQPRDRTHVSCVFCIAGRFFTTESPGKPLTDLSPVLKKVLHIQEMLSQYLLSQQDILPFIGNGSTPLRVSLSRLIAGSDPPLPCHPASSLQVWNNSIARMVPVPVFSMQPYWGRALSLMMASSWKLSSAAAAKKW